MRNSSGWLRQLKWLRFLLAPAALTLVFETLLSDIWQGAPLGTRVFAYTFLFAGCGFAWLRCMAGRQGDLHCLFRYLSNVALLTIVFVVVFQFRDILGALAHSIFGPTPTPIVTAVPSTSTPLPTATAQPPPTITPTTAILPTATATEICAGRLYFVDPPPGANYDVQPGDTLEDIANRSGVTVERLVEANVQYYPSLEWDTYCISDQWWPIIPPP